MAGWALSIPYHVGDDRAGWIPKVAATSGRLQVALWMLLLFALTTLVGAVVTGLMARRDSLRLGTAGSVLTFAGFAGLNFGSGGHDTAAASQQAGLDVATSEKLLKEMEAFTAFGIGTGVFIPLMFVGVILLGIALLRGNQLPTWAARPC